MALIPMSLKVNGTRFERAVEPRRLLSDFLREDLDLKATHVGCEHGVCGTCTVLVDGQAVRSCLSFAVQADGCEVRTADGLAKGGKLNALQQAFWEKHGLQCGFCTPGMILRAQRLLKENPSPSEEEIRMGISGNFCRCTGYQNIVKAIQAASAVLAGAKEAAE
jgi:carbon-monoxide dehydrogenase small subunit